jgi:hypothetical protein
MSAIDTECAINALQEFVRATDEVAYSNRPGSGVVALEAHQRAADREMAELAHVAEQILDAAKKLNAEKQNKAGRRICETDFFKHAFSLDAPAHGKPRLRRRKPDDTDTYKSVQCGARAQAECIYSEVRNPYNHEEPRDIDEQTAVEHLAALSVLARLVDDAEVETAP